MQRITAFLLLLFSSIAFANEPLVSLRDVDKLWKTWSPGSPSTQSLTKKLKVSEGVSIDYEFEVTSKGNGVLKIGNSHIRIYDRHDDGIYFENGLLWNKAEDINDDGFLDVVVWGNAFVELSDLDERSVKVPVLVHLIFAPGLKTYVKSVASEYIYSTFKEST
ncbi:hypothetical protein [Microbulbifer taiwanensis]|uniref:VCBS repeat-containing protein n=1 Tax=Microbulbifer taiwanensis TaxID=986746 RepID=A0ABW1YGE6_9GAMM|nr:hypothetical protein [Microbulbifer taiwanensis]